VLVTGASGFVGARVAGEARRRGAGLRLMSHRSPVADPRAEVVRADLADPGSLRGVCAGVDVLVHCASQIGGAPEANEAVNSRGTAALVREARRAGVSRIVLLSTASVYGRGTYRGSRPEGLVRRPGSATSRTRAEAEDAVLAAGGVVLRPHLVFGDGDVWVGRGLARMLRIVPVVRECGSVRLTAVEVRELAGLVVAVALAPEADLTASVYHAGHPEPVAAEELMRAVAECSGIRRPDGELTAEQARSLLAEHGHSSTALDMMTTDHVFDSGPLWADLRRAPGPAFGEAFRRALPWYRRSLAA
jgi:nucleoside-diphosphate-sugar epimerase